MYLTIDTEKINRILQESVISFQSLRIFKQLATPAKTSNAGPQYRRGWVVRGAKLPTSTHSHTHTNSWHPKCAIAHVLTKAWPMDWPTDRRNLLKSRGSATKTITRDRPSWHIRTSRNESNHKSPWLALIDYTRNEFWNILVLTTKLESINWMCSGTTIPPATRQRTGKNEIAPSQMIKLDVMLGEKKEKNRFEPRPIKS